ncbi:MAG: hypothetical protein F6J92_31790 [Symploca sp. SIO1A3]|nr:hypothetical protein [Symploca sp. SIO1A3]
MSESIVELVDNLPTDNLTVKVLNALDFIVPGQWENLVGFDNTISCGYNHGHPVALEAFAIFSKLYDRTLKRFSFSDRFFY